MISKKKINDFEFNINFKFKNKQNLIDALTHPSASKEINSKIYSL